MAWMEIAITYFYPPMGKVEYEIIPSATNTNIFELSVEVYGHDKEKIVLKIHSLHEDMTTLQNEKQTVGRVKEIFKDLSYSKEGSKVHALSIRVYKAKDEYNFIFTESAIGEVHIPLIQGKRTVDLKKMTEGEEPRLQPDSEDSDYEAQQENSDETDNLAKDLEKESVRKLECKVEVMDKDMKELKLKLDKMGEGKLQSVSNMSGKIGNTGVSVSCTIKPPPGTVTKIHKQIINLIKTTLGKHGHTLTEDGSGPTLVTVVNSSRTQEDIDRDMKAAKLTDSEASDVILLRIVPSLTHNIKVKEMKGENYKLDLVFLAEQSAKKLHECEKNVEACEELFEYLENCLNCE